MDVQILLKRSYLFEKIIGRLLDTKSPVYFCSLPEDPVFSLGY